MAEIFNFWPLEKKKKKTSCKLIKSFPTWNIETMFLRFIMILLYHQKTKLFVVNFAGYRICLTYFCTIFNTGRYFYFAKLVINRNRSKVRVKVKCFYKNGLFWYNIYIIKLLISLKIRPPTHFNLYRYSVELISGRKSRNRL